MAAQGVFFHAVECIDEYGAVPVTLRGIDFPVRNVGWTVGDDGVILRLGEPSGEDGNNRPSVVYPNFTQFQPTNVFQPVVQFAQNVFHWFTRLFGAK